MNSDKKHKIVIIGGGFAGVSCARELAKKAPLFAEIILISNKSYFEYYPALYRVVTCASPIEVCVPLEDVLPERVKIMKDIVTKIVPENKEVHGQDGIVYHYDNLVFALGSEANYFGIEGVEQLAFSFKSTNDALKIKNHIYGLFEEHMHPSEEERVSHYHVVIVGAGPSGVEIAGDVVSFMKRIARKMKVDPSLVTVDLIEGAGKVLPSLPADVSAKVLKKLQSMGVNIFLNRTLMKEDVEQVYLKDMSMKAKTVIWTAGTKINALASTLSGVELSPRKRVVVDEYLRVPAHREIFVVGDCAQTQYTGLAQTAMFDGAYVAHVISNSLRNKSYKEYKAQSVGYAIPIGDNWAVFSMGKFKLYGRFAYMMRHVIDFHFFAGWMPFTKVIGLWIDGRKYRKENNLKEYAQ